MESDVASQDRRTQGERRGVLWTSESVRTRMRFNVIESELVQNREKMKRYSIATPCTFTWASLYGNDIRYKKPESLVASSPSIAEFRQLRYYADFTYRTQITNKSLIRGVGPERRCYHRHDSDTAWRLRNPRRMSSNVVTADKHENIDTRMIDQLTSIRVAEGKEGKTVYLRLTRLQKETDVIFREPGDPGQPKMSEENFNSEASRFRESTVVSPPPFGLDADALKRNLLRAVDGKDRFGVATAVEDSDFSVFGIGKRV
ncbi:uncharacterized protein EV420DRAFT_1475914 [Desarmillaria tabescens]|uniref:Uncharacterized protein n=1 Tax=Armillaria tabescens TaxID=1929756 RepID=A0AA39U0D3_ARMTA|nr:uncharacterized protein EV420DRAFT_1475914 [Desarmillaria tabescens]KAK0464445.1 hypothetical protein EV420DRAFT_1475914 [Desarmillaria tabescens]